MGDVYLFRGTTEGFPGNPALQRLKISPASIDPLVATIFALESKAMAGDAILAFGSRQGFDNPKIDLGNIRRSLEREVEVGLAPLDFLDKAPIKISVDKASQILREMGVADLPSFISTRSESTYLLENTPRLTPEQIAEFIDRARRE